MFIEATEFNGWDDVESIHKWAEDSRVLYVPQGATHSMRNTDEVDWHNGSIATTSPEFLLVETPDGEKRANIGDFVVRAEGGLYVIDPDTFHAVYEDDREAPLTRITSQPVPIPASMS